MTRKVVKGLWGWLLILGLAVGSHYAIDWGKSQKIQLKDVEGQLTAFAESLGNQLTLKEIEKEKKVDLPQDMIPEQFVVNLTDIIEKVGLSFNDSPVLGGASSSFSDLVLEIPVFFNCTGSFSQLVLFLEEIGAVGYFAPEYLEITGVSPDKINLSGSLKGFLVRGERDELK